MSIYQGDTKISGNAMMVALPMFFATYQPRKLNNPSWLRAEPYSWHSADLYVSAYAHLADNISGITAQTETIAGTTITFYPLSDEIKVVLPDQQTNLDAIYNSTGIGYYFVLDTTNRQFKLPRNIYGFTGYRGDVGGYVPESLPNITGKIYCGGRFVYGDKDNAGFTSTKSLYVTDYQSGGQGCMQYGNGGGYRSIAFNAAKSSSTYQNNAPVQERATQAYLYFYVGNTVQNETLTDVGEMSEAINDKVDLASSWGFPTDQHIDLTFGASGTQYTAPADGSVTFSIQTGTNPCYAGLINQTSGFRDGRWTSVNSANIQCVISVKKGDIFSIEYSAANADNRLVRFIYAQKTN